ncbi:MAG TPA: hypothetical protein VFM36_00755 [Thermoanaerobaculia bacterium]|nr:hypothetical protein [Thermoanaerobaculia bacterium]
MINSPTEDIMGKTTETLNRNEIISRLRRELMQGTDEENSVCKIAAERGVFCKGFNRYTDEELRKRYDWIVAKNPVMTREDLERIANDWQLAQQEVHELPMACDVQQKVYDTCRGWNDFTNEQLAKFYFQLTGDEIAIR